jgi:hypothetical protein
MVITGSPFAPVRRGLRHRVSGLSSRCVGLIGPWSCWAIRLGVACDAAARSFEIGNARLIPLPLPERRRVCRKFDEWHVLGRLRGQVRSGGGLAEFSSSRGFTASRRLPVRPVSGISTPRRRGRVAEGGSLLNDQECPKNRDISLEFQLLASPVPDPSVPLFVPPAGGSSPFACNCSSGVRYFR